MLLNAMVYFFFETRCIMFNDYRHVPLINRIDITGDTWTMYECPH